MNYNLRSGIISRYGAIIVFILGILLLTPKIWSETSITGQDEYWLSLRTPMETLEHGSWLTPWVNDEPRLKKPPLLYWAIMLTYKIFGINLFAARIWGVLSGAGLALCSFLLYKKLFKKSGFLAGLITLATMAIAIEGHRAMLDLPLAFFTCMAVYFALNWGEAGRFRWILLSAVSLGLSFMVKGPIGLIFFGAATLSALTVFRKWGFAFSHRMQITAAFILLLAICLPWPLAMAYIWPDYISILKGEMAARQHQELSILAPLSALRKGLVLIFPWTIIFIAASIHYLKNYSQAFTRKGLWLVFWFLISLVPCFFMGCFSRYMVPVIPAACVLSANWLEEVPGAIKAILFRISISLVAFFTFLFCIFFIWFQKGTLMALACLFVIGMLLWITFLKNNIWLATLSVGILFAVLIGGLYPCLGINKLPAEIEKIVGSAKVASYNSSQPAMLSIRLKRSVKRVRSFSTGDVSLLRKFDGFLFVRETEAEDFESLAGKLGITFNKDGCFRTFWSRKTWIRFIREDAEWDDWKKAINLRSLADLRPGICYYRLCPGPSS
ncbi:MAG TPA: glycosyltransferase family 39 protein [Desulfobacteraceae bacterium]|nr:glycosyltransferase family 39 protein [Desulfobacteraceae bacterium]HPJ66824.1 glycosyltransferase family 39 protein [Desulfobacteraceae bacterium]